MIGHPLARRLFICAALLVVALVLAGPVGAQPSPESEQILRELRALTWQEGPTEGHLGSVATVKVPQGLAFLDAANTRRFLELNQNPPRDNHYTLAMPDLSWFAIFFFEDSGYVKDDEKLDAGVLLKTIQERDKRSNDERKRLNMPGLHTVGWHVPPHYDAATKRLEWGLRLQGDDGKTVVNYTIRILGRRGVMHATLVSDPASLDKDMAAFKDTLGGYGFTPGERYAEFKSGDRVAEYGLAALVLGGGAAVAVKSGFAKAIWKFLVVGVVALGGAITAVLRKLRRR